MVDFRSGLLDFLTFGGASAAQERNQSQIQAQAQALEAQGNTEAAQLLRSGVPLDQVIKLSQENRLGRQQGFGLGGLGLPTRTPPFLPVGAQTSPTTQRPVVQQPAAPSFLSGLPQSQVGAIQLQARAGDVQGAIRSAQRAQEQIQAERRAPSVAFEKERAKAVSKRIDDVFAQADKASSVKISTARIKSALSSGAFVGTGAGAVNTAVEFASALGFDVPQEILNKIGSSREAQKAFKGLAIDKLSVFKGSTSNKELDFAVDVVSGFGQSDESSLRAVVVAEMIADKAQQLGALVQSLREDGVGFKEINKQITKFKRQPIITKENLDKRLAALKLETAGRAKTISETFRGIDPAITREQAFQRIRQLRTQGAQQ